MMPLSCWQDKRQDTAKEKGQNNYKVHNFLSNTHIIYNQKTVVF